MPKRPHWIGNPLRDYRYANQLLQVEAAKRCGIDHTMWSLLENLKRSPSVEMLLRINKRTGIPAEDLVKFFGRRKKRKVAKGDPGERGQPARPDQDPIAEHRSSGAS